MGTDPRKNIAPVPFWELGDPISDTVVVPCSECIRLRARVKDLEEELMLANLIIETEPKGGEA